MYFYRVSKKTTDTAWLAERKLNSRVNQPNFIRQSTDFYKSKGTEEAFKILFGGLYGETVEMIQPAKHDSPFRGIM